uniref:4Fe-4S Mo/W bis-MGD-type domain-containing protein n=1 Tax=Erythrolobus australicus TaxID=1077150 RepID=A0A7S1TKS8_9RHOD
MDSVGSNIRVDTRGAEIMRVLPRLNEDVNEEWLSDKARFSYDGLKTQRLKQPMMRGAKGALVPIGWDKARMLMKHVVLRLDRNYREQGYEAHAILGPYVDTYAALKLRAQFLSRFANPVFTIQDQPSAAAANDLRHDYVLSSTLVGLEDADIVLLVGCDPRKEAPLVNTRLRKGVMHQGMQVASIGTRTNLTYPYAHLGVSPKALAAIVAGEHPICSALSEARRPALIVSNRALQREEDGSAILTTCRAIAHRYMRRDDGAYTGFNVLQNSANAVGLAELGFCDDHAGLRALSCAGTADKSLAWSRAKLVFLMGADDVDGMSLSDDAFVVYQGHHGDRGASIADLILPGAAYTEKSAVYANTEGRVQRSKLAFFPPGHAKNDTEILAALFGEDWMPSEDADVGLDLLSPALLDEDRGLMPLDAISAVEDARSSDFAVQSAVNALGSSPFAPPVDNFYMADPITRASTTMAKCTRLNKPNNFDF